MNNFPTGGRCSEENETKKTKKQSLLFIKITPKKALRPINIIHTKNIFYFFYWFNVCAPKFKFIFFFFFIGVNIYRYTDKSNKIFQISVLN